MAASSGPGQSQQQQQSLAQEMRLNQFQQQSLYFLQSGVTELLAEIEALCQKYPELQWKDGEPREWEQGNVAQKRRRSYPGEWRLENQWQNGRFLSIDELVERSDARQQMLENYSLDSDTPDLRNVLREQIYLWQLSEEEKEFCELVLQNLDERGLNYENPVFIASSMLPKGKAALRRNKLTKILQRIQELEPVGCACDSPLQSLLVQAKLRFPNSQLVSVLQNLPSLEVLGSLEDFFAYLERQGLNQVEAQSVLRDLRELEPYPARGYHLSNNSQNFHIYPEIQVCQNAQSGMIEVELLNNLGAKLQIGTMKGVSQQEKAEQRRRRQEAEILLQQLQRREETLLHIAQSVFQQQQAFVLLGVKDLQSMTLQDVAEDINLHVSTVSRCIQSKYCKTPWGTYPLRFFFSQGAPSGQSREQIKERILELLQEFPLSLPQRRNGSRRQGKRGEEKQSFSRKLSDTEIVFRLEKFGIQIARRTVAKYRAELQSEGRL